MYNGWSNYETWNVALWIDNDQGVQEMVREWAGEAVKSTKDSSPQMPWQILTNEERASQVLAEQIEELVSDNNPLAGDASMYSDILTANLQGVDYREIAKGMIEEITVS